MSASLLEQVPEKARVIKHPESGHWLQTHGSPLRVGSVSRAIGAAVIHPQRIGRASAPTCECHLHPQDRSAARRLTTTSMIAM